jgi:hypothetical protein
MQSYIYYPFLSDTSPSGLDRAKTASISVGQLYNSLGLWLRVTVINTHSSKICIELAHCSVEIQF